MSKGERRARVREKREGEREEERDGRKRERERKGECRARQESRARPEHRAAVGKTDRKEVTHRLPFSVLGSPLLFRFFISSHYDTQMQGALEIHLDLVTDPNI